VHSWQTSESGKGIVVERTLKSDWGQREQLRQKCRLSFLSEHRYMHFHFSSGGQRFLVTLIPEG